MSDTTTLADTRSPESTLSASLRGITKQFVSKGRAVTAVDDVTLDIARGEYVVILGPSGCGKSTLLRCMAGLESPTAGSVHLQGTAVYDAASKVDVKPNSRNVGMVFQNYALWPHMTVEDNVKYPLKMRKFPKGEWGKKVADVLEVLECQPYARRLPAELSGGQQQRIALARALVYEPSIMLLDEPLSNLDALLRVSLRTELMRLHRELGYTGLHITHDQEEALEMGDRVVLMKEGKIEQMGPPEDVYQRPVSPYAANFLGVRNRLDVEDSGGVLRSSGGTTIHGSEPLAAGLAKGEGLSLYVRGRDTHLVRRDDTRRSESRSDLALEGTLAQIVLSEGGRRQYIVDIDGSEWFAQHAEDEAIRPGDPVAVTVPVAAALLYQGDDLVSSVTD